MSLTRYHPYLSLALELHPSLEDESVFSCWIAEPVGCVIIPISMFLLDPVRLSDAQSRILRKLVGQNHSKVMLRWDAADVTTAFPAHECVQYLQSICSSSLRRDIYGGRTHFLASNMQPLEDNLCDAEYLGLEFDTTKYDYYEKAITGALKRLMSNRMDRGMTKCSSSERTEVRPEVCADCGF